MATILLIDDTADFRALARLLLEQGGHRVIEAVDGGQGLRLAKDQRPDLILTDLAMPRVSGWDVLEGLKAHPELAEVPTLALSAHAMKGDRERAIAAGFDGFLPKPIDDERFEATIARHLTLEGRSSSIPVPATRTPAIRVETPTQPLSANGVRPVIGGNGRRILVVDDNPDVLYLLEQHLVRSGFAAVGALDGPTALEMVEQMGPELVVCDVMLPGIDGYEVTARIKGRPAAPFLPVVLVTAGTPDRQRGLESGADDFLGKPVEAAELIAKVRSLLRLRDAILEGRRQAEELRRSEKVKERFIATVAHDLRTPLNAMGLTVEMIRMVPLSPEEHEASLTVLAQNIQRMADLLKGLLDYSQLVAGEQPLNLAPFDPRSLVHDVRDSLAATAVHQGLEVVGTIDPGLPNEVISDYAKCRQVVFNLGSNALKFTRQGGVTFRARPDGDGSWAVEVTDTGVGIAPEDLEGIFEEFGQARIGRPSDIPGTGLGLAISRRLSERLGGGLTVRSELGQGSTFCARLPVRLETPPRAS